MFAKKFIQVGETVIIWGGMDYVRSREEAARARQAGRVVMQLDDDLFSVEERGDDLTYFVNHSCDPNVWMKDAHS